MGWWWGWWGLVVVAQLCFTERYLNVGISRHSALLLLMCAVVKAERLPAFGRPSACTDPSSSAKPCLAK